MANNYSLFSECIKNITPDEAAWINSIPTDEPTQQELMEFFDIVEDDVGLDECFPMFAFELRDTTWWLYCEESFDDNHVLLVVQCFLRKFRPTEVFTMTYCDYCSKPRIGEFGGGWLAISATDYSGGNTYSEVDQAKVALLDGTQKL